MQLSRIAAALLRARRGRPGSRDEAGAVLIIWVVALVGLLAMSAMAVDLGNIAQTKEHAETAVQDAALAAVPDLVNLYPGGYANGTTPYVGQIQQAVADAEKYITANYSAATNFQGCAGGLPSDVWVPPSPDVLATPENCIGFFDPGNPSNTAPDSDHPYNEIYATGIAVALPPENVSYTVGRAAGLTSQAVSALAYASLRSEGGLTAGVPFGYPVTGGGGMQCLKDTSNTSKTPCGGFTTGSGQYGILNSPRFNFLQGYSSSGGQNDSYLQEDLEYGIDHQLNIYNPKISYPPTLPPQVCDGTQGNPPGCQYWNATYGTSKGNYVNVQSGQTLNVATPAFFTGVSPASGQGCSGNQTLPPRFEFPDGYDPTGQSCSALASASLKPPSGPHLSSASDEFGQTAALNGASISNYLLPSTYITASNPDPNLSNLLNSTSGCNSPSTLFPTTTGTYTQPTSVAAAASTYPIDYQVNGVYLWQKFDICLSNMIQQGFSSNTAPATVPLLELCSPESTAEYCTPNTSSYTPNANYSGPIFSTAILSSPRFGFVPIVGDTGTGTGPQQIVDWAGAYLDMAYAQGSGKSQKMSAIQAWIFPLSLIESNPSPSFHGVTIPYRGGAYVEALCSLSSGTC